MTDSDLIFDPLTHMEISRFDATGLNAAHSPFPSTLYFDRSHLSKPAELEVGVRSDISKRALEGIAKIVTAVADGDISLKDGHFALTALYDVVFPFLIPSVNKIISDAVKEWDKAAKDESCNSRVITFAGDEDTW